MQFAVEAMRPDGSTVTEQIEAGDRAALLDSLHRQGLLPLRIDEPTSRLSAATAEVTPSPGLQSGRAARMSNRDLILFTRQMKMLLESGAPLVPALEAAEQQSAKPAVRQLLRDLRVRVEEGDSLAAALETKKDAFDPVFRSMIAVGETTATLPQVFARLGNLAQQQQQARKLLLGAVIYPVILSFLLVGVLGILLFFVVPRFKMLFANLKSPLPSTTLVLFKLSEFLTHGWPYVLGAVGATVVAAAVVFRMPAMRNWLDEVLLRLPVIGPLASRLVLARVLRVWAAMLRCHVPLLETVRQSCGAVTNAALLRVLAQIEETVAGGGRMAQALATAGIADPIVVSAIRTGEENGRLAEATDFVSDWLDEDNAHLVQQATRLAEPVLLAVMGVVVGFVAMSLFVPLFDLATAAG